MLKIKAIKTDVGYYCQADFSRSPFDSHSLQNYFFDGKKAETTFNKAWAKIPSIPKKVEKEESQPKINYRYELIDKTLKSKKFPLVLEKAKVTEQNCDGYYVWKTEYAQLQSLYEEKADEQPNLMVDVPFEFNVVLEMDNIKEYGGFSYPAQRTRWANEGFYPLTHDSVQHDLIDTIIFPDIVLPARRSELTSEQTYKVVRKHIQDNINPKYAHITSDYDFCFTVKKKIPLAKKTPYQKNIARYGARKAKYITDYRENREIEIFAMTHAGSNYNGYTAIEGLKGNNIEELKENIDNYLKDLMDKINEPVVDCKCCLGKGVVLENP